MPSENSNISELLTSLDLPEIYNLLLSIAEKEPERIQPAIPTLVSKLESDDELIVERSMSILGALAKSSSGDVATHIDDFTVLLTHDRESIRIATIATCYTISRDDPERVKYYLDDIVSLLDETERQARFYAIGVLLEVSKDYPQEIKPHLDTILECLDDDYDDVQHFAVSTLSAVGKKYPTAVSPAVDDIIPFIEDDNTGTHVSALSVLLELAKASPEDITSAVAPLIRVLEYEEYPYQSHWAASRILAFIARENAAAVEPFVDSLVDFLDHEPTEIRENISYVLVRVAEEHPTAMESVVADLRSHLHADTEAIRTEALGILTTVADRAPGLLSGAIDDLRPALQAAEPTTRQYAAFICYRIAEASPTDVQAAISELGELLADDVVAIRKRAALAIAFVAADSPHAIEPIAEQLHHQLDHESQEDIRSIIAGALINFKESQDAADAGSSITASQTVSQPSEVAASFDDGTPPTDTVPSEESPAIPPTAYIKELIDAIERATDTDDLSTCDMKLHILHDTMRETPIDTDAYDTLLNDLDDLLEHLAVRVNEEQGLNAPLSTRIKELTERIEGLYDRQQF